MANNKCACKSGLPYADCCAPYHEGALAPTAEALMRSRYSAYALGLEAYLLATWHPETRPSALNLAEDADRNWLGLTIKRTENTGENAAIVEFVARYKDGGSKAVRLHEVSNFALLDRWYYLNGKFVD